MRTVKIAVKDLRIGDRLSLDSGHYIVPVVRVTPRETDFEIVYRSSQTHQLCAFHAKNNTELRIEIF